MKITVRNHAQYAQVNLEHDTVKLDGGFLNLEERNALAREFINAAFDLTRGKEEFAREVKECDIEIPNERLEALSSLLSEINRRAEKERADDGNVFTVTIDRDLYEQIKPAL